MSELQNLPGQENVIPSIGCPIVKPKPCPFCGSNASVEYDELASKGGPAWRVRCSNERCNPGPFTHRAYTRDAALKAWNKRDNQGNS